MYNFETERLQMRPFTKDEKKEFVEICLDEQVQKYFAIGNTADEIAYFFENNCLNYNELDVIFAIHCREKIVGFISCYTLPPDSIMIEYVIGSNYRGNGFAKEALAGLLKYTKSINSKINIASFAIESDNLDSINVIAKYNPIVKCSFGSHSFVF